MLVDGKHDGERVGEVGGDVEERLALMEGFPHEFVPVQAGPSARDERGAEKRTTHCS